MIKTGISYITLLDEQINQLFKGELDISKYDVVENEYIVFKDITGSVIGKYKIVNRKLVMLTYVSLGTKNSVYKPKNIEQECYFDLLNNDNIPIKVCIGIAGSGKTKSALKFGFSKLDNGKVDKIILVRNPVGIGEQIGFFKGDKNDKLLKWNNPAKDNLEYDSQMSLEEMVEKGIIQLEICDTMQGRDVKNAWIIVDEAQYLTIDQFKMVGERVSEGSQIVFIGDIKQIYNSKFKENNGLERVFNLRGLKEFGCCELKEDVRSETSKIFATKY